MCEECGCDSEECWCDSVRSVGVGGWLATAQWECNPYQCFHIYTALQCFHI